MTTARVLHYARAMNAPESIVASLDWAKKLKEAGWPQKDAYEDDSEIDWITGCWYWVSGTLALKCPIFWVECDCGQADGGPSYWEHDGDESDTFAAPTAEEILRRLPERVSLNQSQHGWLHIDRLSGEVPTYRISYVNSDLMIAPADQPGMTLVDAAAAMYCYLAEQKLLPSA